MEAEAVRCWCPASCHRNSLVPSLAAFLATGCLVPEYGHAWPYWVVLRHGNRSTHHLCHHYLCGASWSMALP